MPRNYTPTGRPRGRPKADGSPPTPRAAVAKSTKGMLKRPNERKLPIRDVIDPEELRFLRIYLAFGEKDRTEAYRRAYHRKNQRGEWIDAPRDVPLTPEDLRDAPLLDPRTANERSKALLKQKYIQDTLAELKKSPADHARQTLVDNILFGTSTEKKEAVKQIFSDEDKLGFKDASEKWAAIMCEAGAEVVVPLGVVTRQVHCSHCGESSAVEIDLSVELPLSDLFPQSGADAPN